MSRQSNKPSRESNILRNATRASSVGKDMPYVKSLEHSEKSRQGTANKINKQTPDDSDYKQYMSPMISAG